MAEKSGGKVWEMLAGWISGDKSVDPVDVAEVAADGMGAGALKEEFKNVAKAIKDKDARTFFAAYGLDPSKPFEFAASLYLNSTLLNVVTKKIEDWHKSEPENKLVEGLNKTFSGLNSKVSEYKASLHSGIADNFNKYVANRFEDRVAPISAPQVERTLFFAAACVRADNLGWVSNMFGKTGIRVAAIVGAGISLFEPYLRKVAEKNAIVSGAMWAYDSVADMLEMQDLGVEEAKAINKTHLQSPDDLVNAIEVDKSHPLPTIAKISAEIMSDEGVDGIDKPKEGTKQHMAHMMAQIMGIEHALNRHRSKNPDDTENISAIEKNRRDHINYMIESTVVATAKGGVNSPESYNDLKKAVELSIASNHLSDEAKTEIKLKIAEVIENGLLLEAGQIIPPKTFDQCKEDFGMADELKDFTKKALLKAISALPESYSIGVLEGGAFDKKTVDELATIEPGKWVVFCRVPNLVVEGVEVKNTVAVEHKEVQHNRPATATKDISAEDFKRDVGFILDDLRHIFGSMPWKIDRDGLKQDVEKRLSKNGKLLDSVKQELERAQQVVENSLHSIADQAIGFISQISVPQGMVNIQ